jgi:hypothetical protein
VREDARTGADLEDRLPRPGGRVPQEGGEGVGVHEEVLAEASLRPDAPFVEDAAELGLAGGERDRALLSTARAGTDTTVTAACQNGPQESAMLAGTRLLVALVVLVAAEGPSVAANPPDPAGFLPRDGDLAGWSAAGAVRTFPRGRLHAYLDGGADLLEEYGIETAAVREWSRGKDTIAVQCYRMTDAVGACGLLTRVRGRKSESLDIGDGASRSALRTACWKGRWFFQVDVLAGSREVVGEAVALLRVLADRVPAGPPVGEPPLLAVLRTPTMRPGTELLLRGPLALGTAGFPRVLAGEGFALAATATYGPARRASRVLLVDYAGVEAATAAFEALRKEWKISSRASILSARIDSERVLAWRDGQRLRLIVR